MYFPIVPDDKAQRIAEERTRSVKLTGCSPTTTEEDLWRLFPSAESVRIFKYNGQLNGTASVRFWSIREAEEAAMAKTVEVKGKTVRVYIDGVPATAAL